MKSKLRVDPELGVVRYCSRCNEDWPADDEFFYRGRTMCRACTLEENQHFYWRRKGLSNPDYCRSA